MVEILWPSGARQTFRYVPADKFYLIEEGKETLAPQRLSPVAAKK